MAIANGNSSVGTTPPMVFGMEPINGHHLSNLDFTLEVFTTYGSGKVQVIKKADTYKIDDDSVLYYIDTTIGGSGKYYVKATLNIPDAKAPNGAWVEVKTIEAGLTVNP